MSEFVVYHVDANFLLNYLIPDNKEFHEAVREKFYRPNWSDDVYKISKYALGKSLNRVLNFEYTNTITLNSVFEKMENVRKLMNDKKKVVFGLDDVNKDWIQHFEELMKIKNYSIEKADRLILAFFCADRTAKKIYTADSNIIRSGDIDKYLGKLGKQIAGI